MINPATGFAWRLCPGSCVEDGMNKLCQAQPHIIDADVTASPFLVMTLNLAPLPAELVETLNQTYFLHFLVNEKEKVVPPGKSVLSMMLHANLRLPQPADVKEGDSKHTALLERVQEAAHKAFWREVSIYGFSYLQYLIRMNRRSRCYHLQCPPYKSQG